MSFGKFGARPRGMSNPTYWVSRHLQDQRRQAAQANAANKFNDKWNRLNLIFDNLRDNFLSPLNGRNVAKKENIKLISYFNEVIEIKTFIQEHINDCKITDLSKYATALKKLTLLSLTLCKKLSVYDDIHSFKYDSQSKNIILNEDQIYFLG